MSDAVDMSDADLPEMVQRLRRFASHHDFDEMSDDEYRLQTSGMVHWLLTAPVSSFSGDDNGARVWRYVLMPESGSISGWGFFLCDSSGMLATVSDYGSYAYKWTDWGKGDFRAFLCGLDSSYLLGKLAPRRVYDGSRSEKSIREHILYYRRAGSYTAEFGRREWELISHGVDSEIEAHDWYVHTQIEDAYELLVYGTEPQAVAFSERVWPRFVELVKADLT